MGMTSNEFQLIRDNFQKLHEAVKEVDDKLLHLDECLDALKVQVKSNSEKDEYRFEQLTKTMTSMVPDGDFRLHHDFHLSKRGVSQRIVDLKWKVAGEMAKLTTASVFGWATINLGMQLVDKLS